MSENNQQDDRKFYYPFESVPQGSGVEEKYRLRKTSKGNIKKLAEICSMRISEDEEQRAIWAEQANFEPVGFIEVKIDQKTKKQEKYLTEEEKKVAIITTSKKPIYEVDDVFNEYYIHAALAEVLFEGFPKLIEVVDIESAKIKILDEKLFDALLENEVNEAFLDFAGKRNPTSRLLEEFLNQSNGGQNLLAKILEV